MAWQTKRPCGFLRFQASLRFQQLRTRIIKEHQILQKELKIKEELETELKTNLQEKAVENEALKKEILRLNGNLNTDGTV
ncbi:MAG: hypothetical protein WBJ13_02480 [Sedimentibacter sp.]